MLKDDLKEQRRFVMEQIAAKQRELEQIDTQLFQLRRQELSKHYALMHPELYIDATYAITERFVQWYNRVASENYLTLDFKDTSVTISGFIDEDYIIVKFNTGGTCIIHAEQFKELFFNA